MAVMIKEELKKIYKSKNWTDKVNKMTDAQAFAIYTRLRQQGKV